MNSAISPQIISIVSESVPYTPFETLWVPNSAQFIVLGENPRRTGTISVYQLDFGSNDSDEKQQPQKKKKRETLKLQTKKTMPNGFKCGTFGHSFNKKGESSRHFATGDFKGTLNIWDLEKLNKPVFEVENAHDGIINAIDGVSGKYGAAEIVTGSRDGTVRVWDPRTDKKVSEMRASGGDGGRDCWTVSFGDSYDSQHRMVAAGYDNGDVKVLDLRTNKLFFEDNVKNGVCSVEFDRNDIKINKLVVTTLESQYRVYDLKTKHISEGFPSLTVDALNPSNSMTAAKPNQNTANAVDNKKGNRGTTIWRVRHLPQNRDVWVTTLGNGCASIWTYQYPAERVIVDDKGHKKGVMGEVSLLSDHAVSTLSTQPIVSWDWSRSKTGLAAMASLDQTIQIVIVTKLDKL